MRVETADEKGADTVRVAEIYASRQGEGQWTGQPSVFLRVSGCNLRCSFCDTPFASWDPQGEFYSATEIIQRVLEFPEPHVVVTGGEPLIFPAVHSICRDLRKAGRVVTIETAGTVDQPLECDLLSISPKLSSSAPDAEQHPGWHRTHHQRRERIDLVRRWVSEVSHQLKFVVGSEEDLEEVLRYLDQIPEAKNDHVWLMPEGTDVATLDARAQWLEPFCAERGFNFCRRAHIYWYGNKRGT